jgi:hypothetical protein
MNVVLNSNLLQLNKGHRLRAVGMWNNALNGNDTTLIMPFIWQMWNLLLNPAYLNEKFWEHMNKLDDGKKARLCNLYTLDLSKKEAGK